MAATPKEKNITVKDIKRLNKINIINMIIMIIKTPFIGLFEYYHITIYLQFGKIIYSLLVRQMECLKIKIIHELIWKYTKYVI